MRSRRSAPSPPAARRSPRRRRGVRETRRRTAGVTAGATAHRRYRRSRQLGRARSFRPCPRGQTYVFDEHGDGAVAISLGEAHARGLLVVNLADGWAPFIFQDGDGGDDAGDGCRRWRDGGWWRGRHRLRRGRAPGRRRGDRGDDDRQSDRPRASIGIAPRSSTSRTSASIPTDDRRARGRTTISSRSGSRRPCRCWRRGSSGTPGRSVGPAMPPWTSRPCGGSPSRSAYQDREHARRQATEATRDVEWVEQERAARGLTDHPAALAALRGDGNPKVVARAERALRGQVRLRAVRATQAFLQCEGLLSPKSRFVSGSFDLPTHEALAEWERKNDIFGWGILGGETLSAMLQPAMESHLETFRRVLAERVADAAGIVEDGSTSRGERPATYRDESGTEHEVPNLVGDAVTALLAAIHVSTPEDLRAFLRQQGEHGPGQPARGDPGAYPAPLLRPPHGSVGGDRSGRRLVRFPVRRARQAHRTTPRALPVADLAR